MMKRTSFAMLAVCVATLCFFLATCKDFGEPERQPDEGFGIIVPGVGMEGIRLGDSRETVVAKLGPGSGGGIADGGYRAWLSHDYSDGPHVGLRVNFIEESGGSCGPVDLLIAAKTSAGTPYRGRTKEGVGIGSLCMIVRQAYGLPVTTILLSGGPASFADLYCMGNKNFEIEYEDSVVRGISIGYYVPIPQDPLSPCR